MNIFSLGAPSWFVEAINSLWLSICQVLFIFINFLYRVFVKVASVNLFSTEVFEKITGNLYVVMGIAMLFIFAYNLIFMIIDPDDKKSTGRTSKIVKETIISLTVIVLLPTIFNYLFVFQDRILSTNIIGRIILGNVGNVSSDTSNCDPDDFDCTCDFSDFSELKDYSGYYNGWIFKYETGTSSDEKALITNACKYYNSDSLTDSERGAYSIAPTIFSAFYRPANFGYDDCVKYLKTGDLTNLSTFSQSNNAGSNTVADQDKQICINFFYDVTMSKYTGDIKPFVDDRYLNAIISDSEDSSMVFDWLWAIVAGGLAVWMFLCYTLEIGVRVAKLGFLQIISPITVMMRIIPGQKEKVYDKWFNQLKSTYLDVFIRLVIIYFTLFSITLVPDVISTMWNTNWNGVTSASDFIIRILSMVVVILGILKFGQEAPKLLKEFFGGMGGGNYSLSPSKAGGGAAMRSAVYGATTGKGFKDRVGGFVSGYARGAMGGYDKAVKGIDTARTERDNGSTFGGRLLDRSRVMVGMETIGEREQRNLEKKFQTKGRSELNSNVQKEIDTIKSTVEGKLEKEDCKTMLSFSANGQNYSGLNYANALKLRESMQKDVENATTNADRVAAQKRLQSFSIALEEAKKAAVTDAVTDAFDDGDAKGLLNAADKEKIETARRNINISINENKVGIQFDEDGKEIPGSVWGDEITTGEQLFGKDSLRDSLTAQRANISERSSEIQSGNYGKYQANSRMVRGQGKAEKK